MLDAAKSMIPPSPFHISFEHAERLVADTAYALMKSNFKLAYCTTKVSVKDSETEKYPREIIVVRYCQIG